MPARFRRPADRSAQAVRLNRRKRFHPGDNGDAFHRVGTWKLLHATARDAAGTARPAPYGGKALGHVTFTPDGRMMSVVCDGRKELPAGVGRDYSSYCGNYTYDGERLVTRVDAASDLSRIGSDQVRGVRFEGERIVLIPPPRQTGQGEEHREITWERIAAE